MPGKAIEEINCRLTLVADVINQSRLCGLPSATDSVSPQTVPPKRGLKQSTDEFCGGISRGGGANAFPEWAKSAANRHTSAKLGIKCRHNPGFNKIGAKAGVTR